MATVTVTVTGQPPTTTTTTLPPTTTTTTTLPPSALAPVANAGPDAFGAAGAGAVVTLDGSDSFDPEGELITYKLRFLTPTPPPPGGLLNDAGAAPRFSGGAGRHTLELTVTDRGGLSDTDTVDIDARGIGSAPWNANAGLDRNAKVGTVVVLDGSRTNNPDESFDRYFKCPLGSYRADFSWHFAEQPPGSTATLTGFGRFTPDLAGTYRIIFTASETRPCPPFNGTATDQDEVIITAMASDVPPNADAGADFNVAPGEVARLDGTRSDDPDDSPNSSLAFHWTFVSVAPGSLLTNADIQPANSSNPSFTPDVLGDYVLRLEVSDLGSI